MPTTKSRSKALVGQFSITPALELTKFVKGIDALSGTLPSMLKHLISDLDRKTNTYHRFLHSHGKARFRNGKKTYVIEGKYVSRVEMLRKDVDKSDLSFYAIPEIFFVSLVNRFEAFVAGLLKVIVSMRPEVLHGSSREIKFEDLMNTNSVQEIRDQLIEDRIDSSQREGYEKFFRWIENTFHVEVVKTIPSWNSFIEIIQRRHLFVHADGQISSQYLAICKRNKVEGISKYKKGERIAMSPEYFHQTYRCLFEVAVKLTHILWRHVRPDQIAESDENITDLTYELLQAEHNNLACRLLDFACLQLESFSKEEVRRRLIINRAQAYKWRGKTGACKKILNEIDWTACNEMFQIAVAVLNDDFTRAAGLMHSIAKTGLVHEHQYADWPLFKKFRKSQIFLKTFKRLYHHPFSREEKSR
jgi:hypothetical protein